MVSYMTNTYDANNVFARILRAELPCHKVLEDEHTLAFMDVMPRGPGHCLVIPKAPSRTIGDISDESYANLALTVKRVANALTKAFNADGVSIHQFNEAAGGQEVFHLHVHVIPRFTGVELQGVTMRPQIDAVENAEILAANATKIREALGR
jgi:histidine triad (HIT) family protein